jgi:hypothetical protein
MVTAFREALEKYSETSGIRVSITLVFVVGGAVVLTLLYALFIGRHQTGNVILGYLMPILLLVGSLAFLIAGKLTADQDVKPLLTFGVVSFFISAIVSLVVTLVLYIFIL